MTRGKIDMNHDDLNIFIATEIRGWIRNEQACCWEKDGYMVPYSLDHPQEFIKLFQPTDILAHAWETLEEFGNFQVSKGVDTGYECRIVGRDGKEYKSGGRTVELAICYALYEMRNL